MSQATEGRGSYSHPDVGQRVATAPATSFDHQGKNQGKQAPSKAFDTISFNPTAAYEARSVILKLRLTRLKHRKLK